MMENHPLTSITHPPSTEIAADKETQEFLNSLSEKEFQAYQIAKSHLVTSFDLKKSNGFLEWSARKKQP